MQTSLRKPLLPLVALVAVLALGASAPASATEAIVKKARCVACHAVDTKRVGPASNDASAKYQDDTDAPTNQNKKVRESNSGE